MHKIQTTDFFSSFAQDMTLSQNNPTVTLYTNVGLFSVYCQ